MAPKYVDDGDIDLDAEKVIVDGERLDEAGAAALGEDIARRHRGRPSLTGSAKRSPTVSTRVPATMKQRLKRQAKRTGRHESELVREALEAYLGN